MIIATCAATTAVKHGIGAADAVREIERLRAGLPAADRRQEVHVLLRRFADPAREAEAALRREQAPVSAPPLRGPPRQLTAAFRR
ncbi:MAG TPA: hypothetical protein VH561_05745 [Micromonosporaceae bacterium]|jgi:hypothetical protein